MPFEFFVDHVVHAGARVDEGGADDRERAAFLKVAGGAEDALRALQGVGVHAAREHLARRRNHGVVGAGETRDGVEEDDDVALAFGKALGLLDDHFGHLDVTGGGFVEGGGDDLGLDGALHFGHFLGTFVDEEDEERTSGWLAMIAWAMCCIRTVLPDFGGATIRARWPLADQGRSCR